MAFPAGVDTEGINNRVLYATSEDAVTWSEPAVMFNATSGVGVENEPQVLIEGERLYSVAGSWDVNNSELRSLELARCAPFSKRASLLIHSTALLVRSSRAVECLTLLLVLLLLLPAHGCCEF